MTIYVRKTRLVLPTVALTLVAAFQPGFGHGSESRSVHDFGGSVTVTKSLQRFGNQANLASGLELLRTQRHGETFVKVLQPIESPKYHLRRLGALRFDRYGKTLSVTYKTARQSKRTANDILYIRVAADACEYLERRDRLVQDFDLTLIPIGEHRITVELIPIPRIVDAQEYVTIRVLNGSISVVEP